MSRRNRSRAGILYSANVRVVSSKLQVADLTLIHFLAQILQDPCGMKVQDYPTETVTIRHI
jgi:hypothetical protein